MINKIIDNEIIDSFNGALKKKINNSYLRNIFGVVVHFSLGIYFYNIFCE